MDPQGLVATLGFAKKWLEKNKDDLVEKVLAAVPRPKDGRGIASVKSLFNGTVQIDLTDGTSMHVGPFAGARGPEGPIGKGVKGDQGPRGVGFNTRGAWDRGTTYYGPSDEYPYIDWVTHRGSSWYAIDPNGVADEPGRGSGWGVLAAKGKAGSDGGASFGYAGGVAPSTEVSFQGTQEMSYSVRIDFVSDTVMYRGEAIPGSSESDAVWRIKRSTFGADGDTTEVWAGGTAEFDKVWANRLSLSYV